MNAGVLTTISLTGFAVAFFHAAIPTHWLPFVLAGRAQRWSHAKTLLVTAVAGAGHILFTTILGVGVVWLGITLNKKVGDAFPKIAGGALILFGLYYLVRAMRGASGHHHFFGGHAHPHAHKHREHGGLLVDVGHGFAELSVFETGVPPQWRIYFYDAAKGSEPPPEAEAISIETIRPTGERQVFNFVRRADFLESTAEIPEPHEFTAVLKIGHGDHAHSFEVAFTEEHHSHEHHDRTHATPPQPVAKIRTSDWVAIGSLLALLTFSPCEGFLPVYLSGIKFGWAGFFLLSAILAAATLAGMVLFTWLTLVSMEKLKLRFVEKYETAILGGLLCVLGILVIALEH